MSENTRTSPNPPPLPQNIIDGAGIPCAPPPTPEMPPLRDLGQATADPQQAEDRRRAQGAIAPLDDQGRPVGR